MKVDYANYGYVYVNVHMVVGLGGDFVTRISRSID